MAVQEARQETSHVKPMQIEGDVVEVDADGNIRKIVITKPVTERFDITFVWDVLIGVALFGAAIICVSIRAPIIGHPWSLLVGPLVGVILTLKHRPAR
jgi:hypothetical protein